MAPFCLWGHDNPRGRSAHPDLTSSDCICLFLVNVEVRMTRVLWIKADLSLVLPPETMWLKMMGHSSAAKWSRSAKD